MIKFIVFWVAVSSFPVPCDHSPTTGTDEYGRKWISYGTTLQACYDTEVSDMQKAFATLDEAQEFVKNGQLQSGLSDFRIERVETKVVAP